MGQSEQKEKVREADEVREVSDEFQILGSLQHGKDFGCLLLSLMGY